jgi:Zn-dependent protease
MESTVDREQSMPTPAGINGFQCDNRLDTRSVGLLSSDYLSRYSREDFNHCKGNRLKMFGLEQTPFDLRMVAFRIPIRVHPSFWIAAALLGGDSNNLQHTFIWIMVLFVSVLVHEMGHGLAAEAFGWPSEILLYWGGGLAMSQRHFNRTPWREIAVSLAGPFAGFGLYALSFAIWWFIPGRIMTDNVQALFETLFFINLYWGLVNLLPVLPLDGGQVCQSFLTWCRFRNPIRAALYVSALVGGCAAAGFFLVLHSTFAGMMFAMFCFQSIARLNSER